MASAMSIAVLFRYMGFSLGPASVAAIVQGNLKSLLTKKITGSDAEKVVGLQTSKSMQDPLITFQ